MIDVEKYALDGNYDLLSKFETVEDFNSNFEQAMLLYKDKFTKAEYIALNKLRKFAYSEKSPDTIGVAWIKAQKVVAATHKDALIGISRASFDSMLRKAKKLNLITVIHQFRKNKYQKHSVYVFNRVEELTPEAFEKVGIVSQNNTIHAVDELKKSEPITILLKLPLFKDLNTYQQAENVENEIESVSNFEEPEPKTEYQKLSKSISGLFTDKKITYKIYGIWLAQKSKMKMNKPSFEVCVSAIRALIAEVKRRHAKDLKPLNNPAGYFSGTLSKMLDNIFDREMQQAYESDFKPTFVDEFSIFDKAAPFEPFAEFKKLLSSPLLKN